MRKNTVPKKFCKYTPGTMVRFKESSPHFNGYIGQTFTINLGPKVMGGTPVFWADGLRGCWACSHFEIVK